MIYLFTFVLFFMASVLGGCGSMDGAVALFSSLPQWLQTTVVIWGLTFLDAGLIRVIPDSWAAPSAPLYKRFIKLLVEFFPNWASHPDFKRRLKRGFK